MTNSRKPRYNLRKIKKRLAQNGRGAEIRERAQMVPASAEGIRACTRCGDEFYAYVAQYYCPDCRDFVLSNGKERPSRWKRPNRRPASNHENDVEIVDENGKVVWAKDLAERYRKEQIRRQRNDFRVR